MIPTIFHLGPLPINSFGLCVALCFFAGSILLSRSFALRGIPEKYAESFIFIGGIVGLIGARIWYLLGNWDDFLADPVGGLLSGGGFTFYGGFIFSAVTLIALVKFKGISLSAFLDSMGPTLALAYAIGRLGCQLSGDGDYGIATTSVFGMSYSQGVIPTAPGVLVFPTPIFESVISLVVLWLLLRLERSPAWQAPFACWGMYLLLMATERFLIEYIRIEKRFGYGLSQAQWIAVALFLTGLILIVRRRFEKTS